MKTKEHMQALDSEQKFLVSAISKNCERLKEIALEIEENSQATDFCRRVFKT